MAALLQILLLLGFPPISQRIAEQKWAKSWLSSIVLCYALGILLRNTGWIRLDDGLSKTFTEISIVFAIPLLLYSTNVFRWYRRAITAFRSFGLFVLAGLLASAIGTFLFGGRLPEIAELGGMITGLYTGGTPNMQAIAMAVGADHDRIILLNTADIVIGGAYLVFLTSVARRFFGYWLPPFVPSSTGGPTPDLLEKSAFNYRHAGLALLLTGLVIGLALGATWLLRGSFSDLAVIMLLLTSLAIAASFLPVVRSWGNTFELAEYFLLVFSIALGMSADFSSILTNGWDIILFTGFVLLLAVLLHTIISSWLGIDRDTTMIVATAALYGPAFVGQIASVLNNRDIVFSGILMGLLGYMVGNYLGVGMYFILSWFSGT